MFEISEEATFSAAHRLLNYQGKCERLHGHNWRVRAFLQGDRLDESGISFDFGRLRKVLDEVVEALDHQVLNDLPAFEGRSPSAENLAILIHGDLARRIGGNIIRVEVWENIHSCVSYSP